MLIKNFFVFIFRRCTHERTTFVALPPALVLGECVRWVVVNCNLWMSDLSALLGAWFYLYLILGVCGKSDLDEEYTTTRKNVCRG